MGDWISVNDGLPKDKQKVDVYAHSILDGSGLRIAECTFFKSFDDYNKNVFKTFDGWTIQTKNSRHFKDVSWMPLPEPPNVSCNESPSN